MNFKQIQHALKDKKIGIAGCGGLGSNCAVALARVGMGTLTLVDFDVVEKSNLNRQYYFEHQIGLKKVEALKDNIKLINPEVEVESNDICIEKSNIVSLFKDCDVIVEAFDRAEMKQMLIETMCEQLPDKPLVIGLGMAGWGDSNSLHCRCTDNLFICGDEVKEIAENLPPLAPRVGIVANMQANTVLEILLKKA